MKKILMFILFAIATIFTFSLNSVKAEDLKYSYNFSSKQFSGNETKNLDGVNWTLAGDGNYWGNDGTKGQQFGSKNAPYKSLTLSTSDILGTIKEIKIETSGASKINASFTVSVGGTQYGSSTTLTSTSTEYTFSGSSQGEIKFNYTQTSSVALYIKSISVTYELGGSTDVGGNEKEVWDEFELLDTKASLNITYNKVIDGNSSELGFTKLTTSGTVEDGKYLIVYEDGNKAYIFNSTLDTLDAVNNYVLGTIVNDTISIDESYAFTIEGSTIKSSSGKYIFNTSTSNGLKTGASPSSTNTISIDNSGNLKITSYSTTLQFNADSNQMRFRYYKSTQKSLCLYKLAGGSVSYENIEAQIRFGACIEKELYDQLSEFNPTYGVAIIASSKLNGKELNENTNGVLLKNITPAQVTSQFGNEESSEGAYYQFALVLKNINEENYDSEFTARAFVVIDGTYYFMSASEYSIKTLSQEYVQKHSSDENIKDHIGVLNILAK